jgi:hypothetical protein
MGMETAEEISDPKGVHFSNPTLHYPAALKKIEEFTDGKNEISKGTLQQYDLQ